MKPCQPRVIIVKKKKTSLSDATSEDTYTTMSAVTGESTGTNDGECTSLMGGGTGENQEEVRKESSKKRPAQQKELTVTKRRKGGKHKKSGRTSGVGERYKNLPKSYVLHDKPAKELPVEYKPIVKTVVEHELWKSLKFFPKCEEILEMKGGPMEIVFQKLGWGNQRTRQKVRSKTTNQNRRQQKPAAELSEAEKEHNKLMRCKHWFGVSGHIKAVFAEKSKYVMQTVRKVLQGKYTDRSIMVIEDD